MLMMPPIMAGSNLDNRFKSTPSQNKQIFDIIIRKDNNTFMVYCTTMAVAPCFKFFVIFQPPPMIADNTE